MISARGFLADERLETKVYCNSIPGAQKRQEAVAHKPLRLPQLAP